MASTNINNDVGRVMKKNAISSFAGKYYIDVPGWGSNISYIEDPHIRLTKWGANTRNNIWDIEHDLKGMTRKLNRDYVEVNDYRRNTPHQDTSPIYQPNLTTCFGDETRSSHPAFQYRQVEINRWETPILNPQNLQVLEFPISWNEQTRILEKDGVYNRQGIPPCSVDSQLWFPVNFITPALQK
jgi:hypothetical protein